MPYLSIITPALNEEENIEPFLERAVEATKKYNLDAEIIVIDDGSSDRTGEILEMLKKRIPNLVVLKNSRRSGITASVRKGFREATGKYILFPIPADLESDPVEDIPKLLRPLEEGYDVSSGWRINRRHEKIKIISSKFFNLVVRILFGINLHDLGWVKGFRREILDDVEPLRSDWHRFFALFAHARGYKVKEIPLNVYPRLRGKSKFGKTGFKRVFGAFFDLLTVKFIIAFSKKPMFVFGSTGILFLILGTVGGIYLLYLKISVGSIGTHIPLLFSVVVLVLAGIQLFAFGFLAEIMASIKDRLK